MSEAPKIIGILYSRGPHLLRLLHFVRETYPNSKVTLYVPKGYPERNLAPFSLEIVLNESQHSISKQIALLRQMRARNFDLFIVMFPSVKLRTFARLSASKECFCFSVNGEIVTFEGNLRSSIYSSLLTRILGFLTYLRIYLYLSRHKIRK